MNEREAIWFEHQSRRWMLPDRQRQLWMQPNQKLYPPPQPYDRKYSPDQARVPAGNSDGGQWTSGDGGFANDGQFEQPLATASDQPPRSDLSQL